jgi:TolA-binding protein
MRSTSLSRTRAVALWVSGVAVFLFLLLLVRGPFSRDPQATFFFKAQELQAQGRTDLALKHYRLISEHHPESPFAPAALEAQANILTGLARKSGDLAQFSEAIALYRTLADRYGSDRAAGKALLAAGDVAANDLGDHKQAREIFGELLQRYPNNEAYASQATLKLGRLALEDGQENEARDLLQRVLQRFPRFRDACAEAQYHLGVLYETLFKNKLWAENAYRATFERYPRTVWAVSAQERLGMLIYQDAGQRPARLVLIEVEPLPDDTSKNGILAALRPVLAARGLDAGAATLRGWSLAPFWGAFDPANPGRVVEAPFSDFNNVASSANLHYLVEAPDAKNALDALQQELDLGRPVVIYNGAWQLVVGYDSAHQQVLLQTRGSRVQAVPVKDFEAEWKRRAPSGKPFTMITFFAPGEKARLRRVPQNEAAATTNAIVRESTKPTPLVVGPITAPTPAPTPTPRIAPQMGLTPAFVFQLKPLSTADAHRRALRRAAELMRRARAADNSSVLLNLEALAALSGELERLAGEAAPVAPVATPTESPVPLPEGEAAPIENPTPAPTAKTPAPLATPNAAQNLARAQSLAKWFGAPRGSWINNRRDAAAYLDSAGAALRRPALNEAAENLRAAIEELNRITLPTSLAENGALSDEARSALTEAARHLRAARDLEKKAVAGMD